MPSSAASLNSGTPVRLTGDPGITATFAPFSEAISQTVTGLVVANSESLGW